MDLRLLNKRVLESLIKGGAFDSLADGRSSPEPLNAAALRPRLLAAVDSAYKHGNRRQRNRGLGQEYVRRRATGGRRRPGVCARAPSGGMVTDGAAGGRKRLAGCTGPVIQSTGTPMHQVARRVVHR